MIYDRKYMERALELAGHGRGYTSPNPMVGAVITAPDGRIIGEGYHRRCGEGHAEVNAIASVKDADRELLKQSTMYVTLEPCSHYGKTPPCAKLIIDTGIPRVVVGAADPFKEVAGRGIAMLRAAGVDVTEGVMAEESRSLNARFITAHEQQRPWVTLKWARSADGYLDSDRPDGTPEKFSTALTSVIVHRTRSLHDAILAGSGTALADRPRLDCRLWPGRNPLPI
ncbi:MAG: bifunctional diaminohydroxyphosphoribosylaminopyrimidine deaminase/5-amino-6-(5-phosphoribosylamino)uracil reductase RibD, partial [Muribaculaceae bacterium]|nr:bifunctional diaminohydroxyphosphoribosylaminopyrimidine deaminase/5-amino-6-(5-phosphoribosylamino)uracil reductase RibD [Muribaculaceae bacterium]